MLSTSVRPEPERTSAEGNESTVVYSKLRSRTFWLSVIWTALVPLALLYSAIFQVDVPWIANLITVAGIITATYVGGNKARAALEARQNNNG